MSTELLNNLAGRVGALEKDVSDIKAGVAGIQERLTHMPTNADLLKVVSGAQTKILWAIAVPVVIAALKWAWPFLAR